jgi:arylsulfatase
VAALSVGACQGEPRTPPRYGFLITVDTLRADRLGVYGGSLELTPHLDRLAAESQRFERAYATSPFTLPSIAALMTSRYPSEIGAMSNFATLPDGVPTLAARLRSQGIRTAAVVSNLVLRPRTGLDRGFDRYDAHYPQREDRRGTRERTAASTTDAALEALMGLLDGPAPAFLWVHYQDPHGPYTPPPGLRERYLERESRPSDAAIELSVGHGGRGVIPFYQYLPPRKDIAYYRAGYDGEVRYMDQQVGRLLDAIADHGLLDESVIVFTADHGEGLGEDDYWFAHGDLVNEPAVRIPLLIRAPGHRARVRLDLASLVDITPTLAALFGLPGRPEDRGRDLLSEQAGDQDVMVYFATPHTPTRPARAGVVKGDYKFVRLGIKGDFEEQLFRLPDEVENVIDEENRVAATLRQALRVHLQRQREAPAPASPSPSDPDLEALRALGYVE